MNQNGTQAQFNEIMRALARIELLQSEDSAALREHLEKDNAWMERHQEQHTAHVTFHASAAEQYAGRFATIEGKIQNRTGWGVAVSIANAALAMLGIGVPRPS